MRSLRSPLPLAALPLLLLAAPLCVGRALASTGPLVGGWAPIKNIDDPHVKEIAEFAVSEHNKLANSGLTLGKVMKGETQVVAGINYRLVLSAQEGNSAPAKYVATVWEKAWQNFRQLTSFKPLDA